MVNKEFVKITNQNIYDEIKEIKRLQTIILNHQITTNGKVKLNRWIATTALTMIIALTLSICGTAIFL